jgi:hypothetical protein
LTYQPKGWYRTNEGTEMNADTRFIAETLKITLEEALKIQNFIDDEALIDWSEDSHAKIARIAKQVKKSVYAELMGK